MANPYAIQVQKIGKQYDINQAGEASYDTLRDQIAHALTAPVRRVFGRNNHTDGITQKRHGKGKEIFWALRDVNFNVEPGEVVGVIGRNGAGKSTLLKIITRITDPSEGSIDLWGRVGSLLEVGTGFHKELSGRENVYLNGAILGMKRTEIDRKFDEIVAFAEIEKFIDTQVKFYSSGMGVRLAFAVAAHLEPEILLVDEVLAVGDAAFQKKCLNKMEDVGRQGRTILFVSHHMPSITRLCQRAILLDGGHVLQDGPAYQVVSDYLTSGLGTSSERIWEDRIDAPGNEIVRLNSVRVRNSRGQISDTIDIHERVGIEMDYEVLVDGQILYPHFTVHNEEGQWLFVSFDTDKEWLRKPRPRGHYQSTGWIPGNLLTEGTMMIGPAMRTEEPYRLHFHERDAVAFQVVENNNSSGARADHPGHFPGIIRPLLDWETRYHTNGSGGK